jgi:serine/tyrosine/threonine adenylyltransferase
VRTGLSLSRYNERIPSMTLDRVVALSNSYARLPEHFFARLNPTPVAKPQLISINRSLARELTFDLGSLDNDSLAAMFAGNVLPPGAEPIAMAYAGHQFGQFVPQLGDGRAILLGEVHDRNGVRRDIQLKGAGPTPFSRNGDGRAALGPVLREYLISEAMHALGIPATRALAAVSTGERVFRDGMVSGAVLTRVAASHVRVGTFQYFAARADVDATKRLADYVIARHFPAAIKAERPYLALLQEVAVRQASLIASWMHVGFIHGVMNTDNMALSGETIDFGPCAFLDAYDPNAVFSSIDRSGRYAYANQPYAAEWNLARFAETLLPLLDPQPEIAIALASEALSTFLTRFAERWLEGMRRKLGLFSAEDDDVNVAQALLEAMHANQADFTLTFRRMCDAVESDAADSQIRALFVRPSDWDQWALTWRSRLAREAREPNVSAEAMRHANPAFIPRNHRVEQAIDAAALREDYSLFAELLTVLSEPFEEQDGLAAYAEPPQPNERVLKTFCGT